MSELARLFAAFMKVSVTGFGGGYGMMSLIIAEARDFSVTIEQIADLSALDMVVPGPIAINAATYVGFLHAGFWGSLAATAGVMLPSFVIVALVMRFIDRYRKSRIMSGVLAGVKPAAVGLIAAAAAVIAVEVIAPDASLAALLSDPARAASLGALLIFALVAVLNIRFRVDPILLTVAAGIAGALFLR
jgi:chromate transporter